MNSRLGTQRSTEAPMDYEWTSRESSKTKPIWASTPEDPSTPRKRPHDTLNQQTPSLTNHVPMFGANHNVPFIFPSPLPQTPPPYPWTPSNRPSFPEEIKDVDMTDQSPPKQDGESEGRRAVAAGGLKRVYNRRHMSRDSRLAVIRKGNENGEGDSEEGSDDDDALIAPLTQNTSNHYTLNIPSPPVPQSDLPYVLLGYLQFFFNLSLILLFLYLVVLFILTVQRDVEHRISEYSMDIVQEIAMCALQYKNNLCASNPIPAMAQQCGNWETCMNRDPTVVGRAKVGAELIAEVVNGFVEPISWKTLAFTLTSLSFLTVFINSLLSLYRSRHRSPSVTAAAQPPPPFAIPPTTAYPAHHLGGYLSPAPTPSWGRKWTGLNDEEPQTPTRRRRLESGGAAKIK